jgi:hypothetical protein
MPSTTVIYTSIPDTFGGVLSRRAYEPGTSAAWRMPNIRNIAMVGFPRHCIRNARAPNRGAGRATNDRSERAPVRRFNGTDRGWDMEAFPIVRNPHGFGANDPEKSWVYAYHALPRQRIARMPDVLDQSVERRPDA